MLVQNKILITNGRSSVAIRSRPVHAPFDSFAFPSRIFFSHNFFAVWKRNSSYNLVSTSRSQGSVRSFSLPLFPKWTLNSFFFYIVFDIFHVVFVFFIFYYASFSLWISILGIIIGFIGDTRARNISERRGKRKKVEFYGHPRGIRSQITFSRNVRSFFSSKEAPLLVPDRSPRSRHLERTKEPGQQ